VALEFLQLRFFVTLSEEVHIDGAAAREHILEAAGL